MPIGQATAEAQPEADRRRALHEFRAVVEAVQYPTRGGPHLFKNAHHVLARAALVDHHRQPHFVGERQLRAEPPFLLFTRGVVTEKVHSGFADRHDAGMPRVVTQQRQVIFVHLPRVVRVHADAQEYIGMPCRERVGTFDQCGRVGDLDQVRYAGLVGTRQHRLAVLVEALVAQVAVGVDHAAHRRGVSSRASSDGGCSRQARGGDSTPQRRST